MGPGGPRRRRRDGSRYGRCEAVLHGTFDDWHRGAHGPVGDGTGTDRADRRPDRRRRPRLG